MILTIVKIIIGLAIFSLAVLAVRKYLYVVKNHKNAFKVDKEKALKDFYNNLHKKQNYYKKTISVKTGVFIKKATPAVKKFINATMEKSKQLKLMWWALRHKKDLQKLQDDPQIKQAIESMKDNKNPMDMLQDPKFKDIISKFQESFSSKDIEELKGLSGDIVKEANEEGMDLFGLSEKPVDYFEKLVNITDSDAEGESVTDEERKWLGVIKKNPKDAMAYLSLGKAYMNEGRTKYAKESFKAARKLGSKEANEHLQKLENL